MARNIKHSKVKNTGVLFELLVRQITSDTLNGVEKSPALKIVKEYFGKKSTLKKELDLYNSLIREKFSADKKAERFLDVVLTERSKLSQPVLKRQKYNLIKEIGKHYPLESFFKTQINNYKLNASIYQLFESIGSARVNDPKAILTCRETIVEHVSTMTPKTTQDRVIKEFSTQDKSMRLLSYRVLLEKFNETYGTALNTPQKELLKTYIGGQSEKLTSYVNIEAKRSSVKINNFANKTDNKIIAIKLKEVANQLKRVARANIISETYLITMMNVYELLEEFTNVDK